MSNIRRRLKIISAFLLVTFMNQLLFPLYSYALTSGPSAPEFSSFEPVATTNMVDPFSGGFTYNLPVLNVPGPEGGGYALSLSYHSGVTPEEEASWVGFGWTLNPGSLNRNKQGFPDDYKGAEVTDYNKVRPNWTSAAVIQGSLELKTKDTQKDGEEKNDDDTTSTKLTISLQKNARINNYKGFYSSYGFGVGIMGMGSLNMTTDRSGATFGVSVNPMKILKALSDASKDGAKSSGQAANATSANKGSYGDRIKSRFNSMSFSVNDFYANDVPYAVSDYKGFSMNMSISVQLSMFKNIGIQFGNSGNLNIQRSHHSIGRNVYGYLHTPNLSDHGAGISTDFSVERDGTFSTRDKYLGVPFANVDQFVSTGEKVMGGFRGHHYQMGQFYPSYLRNKTFIVPLGFELSIAASDFSIGSDIGLGYQQNEIENWGKGTIAELDLTGFTATSEEVGGISYKRIAKNEILAKNKYVYPSNDVTSDDYDQTEDVQDPIYLRLFIKQKTLGERIAFLREEKGLKQSDLATLVGVTEKDIINYEENATVPSAESKRKLAEALAVSFDYLSTGIELPSHIASNSIVTLNGEKHLKTYLNELCPDPNSTDQNSLFEMSTLGNPDNANYVYVYNNVVSVEFADEDVALKDKAFFKFSQDPANEWYYTDPSNYKEPTAATLNGGGGFPGTETVKPSVASLGLKKNSTTQALSSTVEFLTKTGYDTDIPNRFSAYPALALPTEVPGDAVCQFKVLGNDGSKTIYGLPVFTKNELNINVDVAKEEVDAYNYLAYKSSLSVGEDNILDNNRVVGSRSNTPYTTNHLLTEIQTQSYIDVTGDGPTNDDIGGWTKFEYRTWHAGDWYTYRTPYKGLYFQKNAYSDDRDDLGSVSIGEKQVKYLKGIETKTHYAFFVTNKTLATHFDTDKLFTGKGVADNEKTAFLELLNGSGERWDSYPAPDVSGGIDEAASKDYTPTGTKTLEKLEKIVLVSKADPTKPVKITHFEYDYSLCKNVPNNISTDATQTGKLTLKSVWFESDGIVRNKIAPYKFEYNYPSISENGLVAQKYGIIAEYGSGFLNQNPDYSPHALDAWGNYRSKGEELAKKHFPWVNQNPEDSFDPAAWNLKKIILPSGGEILVQYEQNEYAYVQDKKAACMQQIQIIKDSYDDGVYNVDFPADVPNDKKSEYIDQLKEFYYTNEKPLEYIYFRFFYTIDGAPQGLDGTNSEYITGYTTVYNIEHDEINDKVSIFLGDPPKDFNEWDKDENISEQDGISLPREVCYDYYTSNRADFEDEKMRKAINEIDENIDGAIVDDKIKAFKMLTPAFNSMGIVIEKLFASVPSKKKVCQNLDASNSYLRVPIYKSKKGGGVRVKRILMYDKGMESRYDNLYGSEYHYTLEDGTSSGVATNEPMKAKEENPLVSLLDRANCSFMRKVFIGEERNQVEGPLGANVMSGPSVGYSRVVVENIHKGETGTGYQVHNFNTCKEYPFFAAATTFPKENKEKDWMKLPLGLININVKKAWYSQGYAFVRNNMHGKAKKIETYAGTFNSSLLKTLSTPVSYTEYEYFEEGEKVKCLYSKPDPDNINGILLGTQARLPGVEEEVAVLSKRVVDNTLDFSVEFDITIGWTTPVSVEPGFGVFFNYAYNEYGTHVMSKVWNMPSILKKTTSYSQGVETVSENLAFDIYTGEPLVTKTYDGYHGMAISSDVKHNGSYYSYKLPAYLFYSEMGPKSLNPGNTNQIKEVAGGFSTYGAINENQTAWIDLLNEEAINPVENSPEGVISASATVFENNVYANQSLSKSILDTYLGNISGITQQQKTDATSKLNSLYKPVATYTYKGKISDANDDTEGLVFQSGELKQFGFFKYNSSDLKKDGFYKEHFEEWMLGSEITAFSPAGMPVEERNVLDIYSAVRLGYEGDFLPVIVAMNANYESIFFNDYENSTLATTANSELAHSGVNAIEYTPGSRLCVLDAADNVTVTDQLLSQGGMLKVWIKSKDDSNPLFKLEPEAISIFLNNSPYPHELEMVAQAEDWSLFTAHITNIGTVAAKGDPLSIYLNSKLLGNEKLYIDDVCFHPFDAEVSCNVYDVKNLRLITQFNSQHFGTYYIYNEEGNLVRQSIETERGIKMIKESQFNLLRAQTRK